MKQNCEQIWDLIERVADLSDAITDIKAEAQALLENDPTGETQDIIKILNKEKESEMFCGLIAPLQRAHSEMIMKEIRNGEPIPKYLLQGRDGKIAIEEVINNLKRELTKFIEQIPSIKDSGGELELRSSHMDRDIDVTPELAQVYWVGTWQLAGGDELPDASNVGKALQKCQVIKDLNAGYRVMDIGNMLVAAVEIKITKVRESWLRLNDILL